jgi:hypothetical protein
MKDITIHCENGTMFSICPSKITSINLIKKKVIAVYKKPFGSKMTQNKFKGVTNAHEILEACEAFHKNKEGKKEIIKPESEISNLILSVRTQSPSGFGIGPLNNNLREMGPAPIANIKRQNFLKVTDLTKKINLFFKIP